MSSLLSLSTMSFTSENPPLKYSYGITGHGEQNVNCDNYLVQQPSSVDTPKGGEFMFGGRESPKRVGGR